MNKSLTPRLVSRARAATQAWRWRMRSALGPFYVALGAALMARVAVDALRGVWRIHSGELFPWRHLPVVPLYSTHWLLVEWLASLAAGSCMVLGVRLRLAVGAALVASLAGLSQRSSNQQWLMLIVLAFLALNPNGAGFTNPIQSPNMTLLKAQLAIVYVFSALEKVRSGFLDGATLHRSLLNDAWLPAALFGTRWPAALWSALSWGVVLAEFALPGVLSKWPRLGVLAVALLHLSFATALPGVLPFGLVMLAMSLLFLPPPAAARAAP